MAIDHADSFTGAPTFCSRTMLNVSEWRIKDNRSPADESFRFGRRQRFVLGFEPTFALPPYRP